MIIKGNKLEVKDDVKRYPIKEHQDVIAHFVTRFTTKYNPFKPHKHDGQEFWYILEGKAKVQLDGKETEVEEGDLILLAPWVEHGLTSEKGVYWICFG